MNGYVFTLLFVPLIAFIVIVLPTWIVLNSRDRNRRSRALGDDEWLEIKRTLEMTEKLDQRIATLEAILDHDHKGWRNQQ